MKSLNEISSQSCAIFSYQIGKREGAEQRNGRPEFVFLKIKNKKVISFKSAIFRTVTPLFGKTSTHSPSSGSKSKTSKQALQ
jgi:hypothetical protein